MADIRVNPVHWVKLMIKLIPASPGKPFFLAREGTERYPLTSGQIRRLLKEWCNKAGVQDNLTPHCLRRGGLTLAHDAQVSTEALKIMGDWSSNAYMRYLDVNFRSRVKTGQKIASFLKQK